MTVPGREETGTRPSERFATVAIGYGAAETKVAISALGAYGAIVVAQPLNTASVCWHWVEALGGVEIRTPVEQADLARRLLQEQSAATRTRRRSGWLKLTMIAMFLAFGVPPPSTGIVLLPYRASERGAG
jgi:hypothetical protein